ncbi:hypothetical protein KFZ76_19400 [Methylovulum psychrotolerans]|uniref:hypothetical protein n=1 Tax=Methylovulum psychrotolerans TaxID=1704499 RepID=UPI001BFF6340|nr:hypothetical protein [Methylovulum psychrotolerans]MBT9099867.1 hypothetical protein [Methylovulum psychrotolerans]
MAMLSPKIIADSGGIVNLTGRGSGFICFWGLTMGVKVCQAGYWGAGHQSRGYAKKGKMPKLWLMNATGIHHFSNAQKKERYQVNSRPSMNFIHYE